MSDEDIIEFCESDFVEQEYKSLYSQTVKSAKVDRTKSSDSGR